MMYRIRALIPTLAAILTILIIINVAVAPMAIHPKKLSPRIDREIGLEKRVGMPIITSLDRIDNLFYIVWAKPHLNNELIPYLYNITYDVYDIVRGYLIYSGSLSLGGAWLLGIYKGHIITVRNSTIYSYGLGNGTISRLHIGLGSRPYTAVIYSNILLMQYGKYLVNIDLHRWKINWISDLGLGESGNSIRLILVNPGSRNIIVYYLSLDTGEAGLIAVDWLGNIVWSSDLHRGIRELMEPGGLLLVGEYLLIPLKNYTLIFMDSATGDIVNRLEILPELEKVGRYKVLPLSNNKILVSYFGGAAHHYQLIDIYSNETLWSGRINVGGADLYGHITTRDNEIIFIRQLANDLQIVGVALENGEIRWKRYLGVSGYIPYGVFKSYDEERMVLLLMEKGALADILSGKPFKGKLMVITWETTG